MSDITNWLSTFGKVYYIREINLFSVKSVKPVPVSVFVKPQVLFQLPEP